MKIPKSGKPKKPPEEKFVPVDYGENEEAYNAEIQKIIARWHLLRDFPGPVRQTMSQSPKLNGAGDRIVYVADSEFVTAHIPRMFWDFRLPSKSPKMNKFLVDYYDHFAENVEKGLGVGIISETDPQFASGCLSNFARVCLANRYCNIRVYSLNELVDLRFAAMRNPDGKDPEWELCKTCQVLLIDEIGAGTYKRSEEWQQKTLAEILNTRKRNLRPVCFASHRLFVGDATMEAEIGVTNMELLARNTKLIVH